MMLRRATPADAGKLSLIGQATFLESFASDHDGDTIVSFVAAQHSVAAAAAALRDPHKRHWIVEAAVGAPVGYAAACPASLPQSDAATDYELKRLYVLSRWHGGGWGARLYQAVEDDARARGARRLMLSVYARNEQALAFYRARGFAPIGEWQFDEFSETIDLICAKTL
jgi:diamine N-acetyltransferase